MTNIRVVLTVASLMGNDRKVCNYALTVVVTILIRVERDVREI